MVPVIGAGAEQRAGIKDRRIEHDLAEWQPVAGIDFARGRGEARMDPVPLAQQADDGSAVVAVPVVLEQPRRGKDAVVHQHARLRRGGIAIAHEPIFRHAAPPVCLLLARLHNQTENRSHGQGNPPSVIPPPARARLPRRRRA